MLTPKGLKTPSKDVKGITSQPLNDEKFFGKVKPLRVLPEKY